MDKMYAIVNPVSANKSTAKEWPEFEKTLKASGYEFETVFTEYPGHATLLAGQALKHGYRTIMSVGGDGTMNEVMNGFFEDGKSVSDASRLVVFSRGTGCDFIKTLGIKKGIEDLLAVLAKNEARTVDVGCASFVDCSGKKVSRYFLNVADIGIGAETANRVNNRSKLLKGFLSFALGAVATIAAYSNKKFEVVVDGQTVLNTRLNSVIIANGRYFGGGMKVAPNASMDDGVFDIIVFGDLSKLETIKSFPLIYDGKHLSHPKLLQYRGSKVIVRSGGKSMLELDGEIPGRYDAEFHIMPKSLNILV